MTPLTLLCVSTNTIISLVFLNEYVRTKFPTEYQNFCLNFMYYCIYSFSKVQHNMNKFILGPITKFIAENIPSKQNDVEFILNGEVICVTSKRQMHLDPPDTFDFVIYTEGDRKKIINNFPLENEFVCEPSYLKFVLIEIQFVLDQKSINLKIDFKPTATDSFYVDGNIFHTKFIRYLLHKYYEVDYIPDDYKIKILDHSITRAEFDDTKYIKIEKDLYSSTLQ